MASFLDYFRAQNDFSFSSSTWCQQDAPFYHREIFRLPPLFKSVFPKNFRLIAFHNNNATFSQLKVFQIFFQKTPNREKNRNFHHFIRILQQICYLLPILRKIEYFPKSINIIFFKKDVFLYVFKKCNFPLATFGKFALTYDEKVSKPESCASGK